MGGGARGLAHIGVLDVLHRNNLSPDVIVGTSMGAVIGGLFAAGFSPVRLKEMMRELSLDSFIERPNLPFLPKKPYGIIDLFLLETYRARLQKKLSHGKEDKIEKRLRTTVGDICIEDLPVKFACNAVDLVSGKEIVFDEGRLYKALRATISLPVVFEPLKMDNMLLVDGGVLNNAPIEIARNLGADKTVLVDIHRPLKEVSTQEIKNTFQLIQRMVETMAADVTAEKIKEADFVVRVDLDVDSFDFSSSPELIEAGELATVGNLDNLKKFIH